MNNLKKEETVLQVEIPKSDELLAKTRSKSNLRVGDVFYTGSDYNPLCKITAIGEVVNKYTNKTYTQITYVDYESYEDFKDGKINGKPNKKDVDDFFRYKSESFLSDPHDAFAKADKVLAGELKLEPIYNLESTLPVHSTNRAVLETMYNAIEIQKAEITMINQALKARLKQTELEMKRKQWAVEAVIKDLNAQLKKVMKFIGMIELYLGIDEELFQLSEGIIAPPGTPITLRQQVLYADEEIGITEDHGIDFTELHKFDEWLLKDRNFEKMIPEAKGIVVFKPRRYDKDYGDRFTNERMNRWNRQSYFLIRNGYNLYRICSDNIQIGERLFPKQSEMNEIMDAMNKTNGALVVQEKMSYEEKALVEKVDNFQTRFQKIVLFIQGLISRTEILHPVPDGINFADLDATPDAFNLIRDDENLLAPDKMTYQQWVTSINGSIGTGSRIIYISPGKSKYETRFLRYYANEYSEPDAPDDGIYTLEEFIEKRGKYHSETKEWSPIKYNVIKYNPGDTIYSRTYWGDDHERKQKVSWIVKDGDIMLNYDALTVEDIDYYLQCRLERKNYLGILPVLREAKHRLLAELEHEKDFKTMLKGLVMKQNSKLSEAELDAKIEDTVKWWKTKNKWKRPIAQDDAKAMRMIKSKLLK